MLVWRLGRNVVGKYDAKNISGKGAFLSGGRWNSKGYHGVYASLHPAAAVLEAMVRLGRMNINPIDRYLIAIEIPDAIWNDPKKGVKRATRLPQNWDAFPAHQATMIYGDKWLNQGKQLGLLLPSAIVEEESTILLNPHHPLMPHVKVKKIRPFIFDPRRITRGSR